MMKKIYITPNIGSYNVAASKMICGSGKDTEVLPIDPGDGPDPGGGGGIWGESKWGCSDDWDDEE